MTMILNDIHIGVQRQAGTTPMSQEALRTYLFTQLRSTLAASTEDRLLVLGDLFDTFEVPPRDWIETFLILSEWLGHKPVEGLARNLILVAGNHDHSPKASKVSSFQVLCRVLLESFRDQTRIVGIDEWAEIDKGVIALAHCSNQDIFDQKLAEVLKASTSADEWAKPHHLLLHANFDNHFAVQSDHSLNVSEEQAKAFNAIGVTLVFAHEHQARRALDGGVVVLGNQWPTSVADCLGNDEKFAHTLVDGAITKVKTWGADTSGAFARLDWRDLFTAQLSENVGFFRVEGTASSNEASDVINFVAKFRQQSSAFVITNAVKIDGLVQNEALPESFEAAKKFDVMEFIKGQLEPDEYAAVLKLQGEQQ